MGLNIKGNPVIEKLSKSEARKQAYMDEMLKTPNVYLYGKREGSRYGHVYRTSGLEDHFKNLDYNKEVVDKLKKRGIISHVEYGPKGEMSY